MSLLPALNLVTEYNKGRSSCLDNTTTYEITSADKERLSRIASVLEKIKPQYDVILKVCPHSGQVYLSCKVTGEEHKPRFPSINKGAMKV